MNDELKETCFSSLRSHRRDQHPTFSLRPTRVRVAPSLLARALLVACALLACDETFAQQRTRRPAAAPPARTSNADTTQKKKRSEAAVRNNAEREERDRKRRREQAVAALGETGEAARRIEDLHLRAQLQTLAADALWRADEPTARTLFRRAWETATASDRAASAAASSPATGDADASEIIMTNAREGVLAKVAARDSRLAEIFLRELATETDGEDDASGQQADAPEAAGAAETQERPALRELSENAERRLALAIKLVEQRAYRQAAQVVAPLTEEGASVQLLLFLLQLRPLAAAEADELYLRLLQKTATDARADANDVLVLSSYVASPRVILAVNRYDSLQIHAVNPPDPATGSATIIPVPSPVRRVFFDVAASILLRAPVAPNGVRTTHGKGALYFALGRLLPFFEREAAEHAPELHARLASVSNELEARERERLAAQNNLQSATAKNPTDPLRAQLDSAARESNPRRRDELRLRVVRTAARRRLWERAGGIVASIEDDAIRRIAQRIVAYEQIKNLTLDFTDDSPLKRKDANVADAADAAPAAKPAPDDYERAAAFVRSLDLPPVARAHGFAQAATMAAARGKHARAAELLEEASRFAASTREGTSERITAYGVVAHAAAHVETLRAWELLPPFVQAINAVEDYTGDRVSLDFDEPVLPNYDETGEVTNAEQALDAELRIILDTFRLDALFATMGRLDFARALAEARTLKRDAPRAFAVIAAARAALDAPTAKTAARPVR